MTTTFALPGVASAVFVAIGCLMAARAPKTGTASRTGAKDLAAAVESARAVRPMGPGLFVTAYLSPRAVAITINAKPVKASAEYVGAACPMVRLVQRTLTAAVVGVRVSHQPVAKAHAGPRRMMGSNWSVTTPPRLFLEVVITISAKQEKADVECAVARFLVELLVPRKVTASAMSAACPQVFLALL